MFMISPLWIMLVGPTILLAIWAQFKVKSAFARYSKMGNSSGYSGAEAAAEVLRNEGVTDVKIEMVNGWLSDHYDPSSKTLRLSPSVYSGRSVAAVGIAAHEAGHALQHAQDYALLGVRTSIVPMASVGSYLSFFLIPVGIIFSAPQLIFFGIIGFAGVVAFQMITLPVEFNASSRAKEALERCGILRHQDEITGVQRVLGAAAMTYVAATLQAAMQLLYYLMIFAGGGRDD